MTKKGFITGFLGSLAFWFFFATISFVYFPKSMVVSVFVWIVFVTFAIWWAVKYVHINHSKIPKKIVSGPLWVKATITGSVISMIVIIAKVAGPSWGGIFATFPALTISTMLITVQSGGVEFTRLIAKNVLISTTTTISMFAIFTYFLYPLVGVIWGSILAYFGLLIISIPLYLLIFDKLKD